jgi:hypothetical protein
MNPMIGCRMQQACEPWVRTVAVVRSHEDGAGTTRGSVERRSAFGRARAGTPGDVDGGVVFEEP